MTRTIDWPCRLQLHSAIEPHVLCVARVYSAIDRRIGCWLNGQFTSDTVAETVQLQLQRPAYAFTI